MKRSAGGIYPVLNLTISISLHDLTILLVESVVYVSDSSGNHYGAWRGHLVSFQKARTKNYRFVNMREKLIGYLVVAFLVVMLVAPTIIETIGRPLIFMASFLVLALSAAALTTTEKRIEEFAERNAATKIAVYGGALVLLGILAMECGMIARGETSPSPFTAYSIAADQRGVFYGIFYFVTAIIFLLWAFVVPAHLYANRKVLKGR